MRATPPDTERLSFRELDEGDLDFLATLLADPEVMRFYPKTYSRDEATAWIARQRDRYARDGHGLWLVSDRATGAPLGQVGLLTQLVDGVAEPEIGYLIHRPFWRRGYAIEAARAVKAHAFGTRDLPRVISLVRPVNLPSQAVARANGMTVEKETTFAHLPHLVFAVRRP